MAISLRSAAKLFHRNNKKNEPHLIVAMKNPEQWAIHFQGTDDELIEMVKEIRNAEADMGIKPFGRA